MPPKNCANCPNRDNCQCKNGGECKCQQEGHSCQCEAEQKCKCEEGHSCEHEKGHQCECEHEHHHHHHEHGHDHGHGCGGGCGCGHQHIARQLAVGVENSPDCPYEWMIPFTKEILEKLLLKGEIKYFYDLWSDFAKTCMSFLDFGRVLVQTQQMHGKFTMVGEPSKPVLREGTTDFWLMEVPMFVDDIEFFCRISLNKDRQVGDFQFARICKYHPPSYIKEEKLERIVINESDPVTVFTKPKGVTGTIPVAILCHSMPQANVDLRIGYTFIGKDYEFLACAGIGVLRSEYTDDMCETQEPPVTYISKCIEAAMQREECGGIYLLIDSYAALFVEKITKKFPGIINGIILLNPAWYPPPNAPVNPCSETCVPKDIPMLVIGSAFDNMLAPSEFKKWKSVAEKAGKDVIFYDSCDHFLVAYSSMPIPQDYAMNERHVSDVPLRKMAQWIRQNDH